MEEICTDADIITPWRDSGSPNTVQFCVAFFVGFFDDETYLGGV